MNIDFQTDLIFQAINNNFELFCRHGKEIDWGKILERASFNRVLYLFVSSLLKQGEFEIPDSAKKCLEEIEKKAKHNLKKLSNTLEFINSVLEKQGIPFLVTKTFKLRPFVTRDVDILLKKSDVEKALELFRIAGCKIKYFSPKKQWDVAREDLLNIDTHTNFHWQKSTFLDSGLLWENSRSIKSGDGIFTVPGIEMDVSAVMLNTIYESMHISMLDFLYIKDTAGSVDWAKVYEQSLKHGWSGAFSSFAQLFNGLAGVFYPLDKSCRINLPVMDRKVVIPVSVSMPYIFSWVRGFSIFAERVYKRKYFPVHDIAYFVFAKARYHLIRGRRVPMYHHWFDFTRFCCRLNIPCGRNNEKRMGYARQKNF